MKNAIKLLAVSIIGAFLLNSCNTTNDVVSSGLMSKRKYNKGFHFNNNSTGLDLAKKSSKEKMTLNDQVNYENKTTIAESPEFIGQKTEIKTNEIILTSEKENKVFVQNKPSQSKSFENIKTVSLSTFEPKKILTKISKNETAINVKKIKYHENKNNSDIEKLLLIILCFLLPPLAVFLFKGSWTMEVTISVILTLFFWVPGIIYALYVVLF